MAYELYFTSPNLKLEDFKSYFSTRKNIKVMDYQKATQAWYENEDTGVYFSFDYETDGKKAGEEGVEYAAAHRLNFCRPHVFGFEAEKEVNEFVKTFGLGIFDPQEKGMGSGPYSAKGFLTGWSYGNAHGSAARLGKEVASIGSEQIESVWRWNYSREENQAKLGDNCFVPKILFFNVDGNLKSAFTWGDAICTVLPKTDGIIVIRKELAAKSFFSFSEKEPKMFFVPFGVVEATLEQFVMTDLPMTAYKIPNPVPNEVVKLVKRLKVREHKIEGVRFDDVLTKETLQLG